MASLATLTYTTTFVGGSISATATITTTISVPSSSMASGSIISARTSQSADILVVSNPTAGTQTTTLGLVTITQGANVYPAFSLPAGFGVISEITAASTPSSTSQSSASTPSSGSTSPSASSNGVALDTNISSFTTASSTSTSGSAAPASSTSAGTSSSTSSNSNVGLEAGIGVLAGLLALALIAIAVLLLKRRRGSKGGYRGRDSAMSDVEGVRSRTTEKDILLRDAQTSLMANSGPGKEVLDDKYVAGKFARLNQDINDWVLAHFKHMTPYLHNLPSEVRQAVSQQPNWPRLLQDSRGRFLIIRGIVADYIYESFHTGDINGLGETMRMKNHLPENIPFHEQSRWRASTVGLMEQDPAFRGRQATSVQGLAQKIDQTTATLAGLEDSDARLRHLTRIIQFAADIALELSRQRVDFYLFAPRESTFDPAKMEDVLQEARSEDLEGAEVLSIVFPAVLRHGDVSGATFDSVNVISKAQVLVNHDGRAI